MRSSVLALFVGTILLVMLFAPLVNAHQNANETALEIQPSADVAEPEYMKFIHVNDLRFDPLAETPKVPRALTYDSIAADEQSYYVVQFNQPVKDSMKRSLESTGAKILYYVSYNAFVVRADAHTLELAKGLSTVRWTGVFEPAYKISPTLSERYAEILGRATSEAALGDAQKELISSVSSGTDRLEPVTGASDASGNTPSHLSPTPEPSSEAVTIISPEHEVETADSIIQIQLLTFEPSSVYAVAKKVGMLGATDLTYYDGEEGKVRATVDRGLIPAIARMPDVMWIERYVQPHIDNDIARWVIQSGDGITYETPVHDMGIYGTNQTVTVCDTGIDWHHDAFQDSVNISPSHRKITDYYIPTGGSGDYTDNGINHGTHTSGTVAGDDGTWHVYDGDPLGSSGTTGPHDGQAFDAKVQMQDLSMDGYGIYPPSDYHNLYQGALNRGSYIHSNSWGGPQYEYVSDCVATDDFIWDNQDMIVLYSAGNPGSGLGWISSYAGSKNVIGVGAGGNGASREEVASFSGRGPTADGRLKPDVIAPGVSTWSAHGGDPGSEYDDYAQLSGTSMSCPAVAGSAALVRQYYMEGWYPTGSKQSLNGFVPSAALVKATIINSAVEMTGSTAYMNNEYRYPNYNQGWGRVTLDEALYFEGDVRGLSLQDDRTGLSTSGSASYPLAIGDTSVPVEITLVWSDYPGAAFANPTLVNDLDLVVTGPDGTVYRGNQYQGYNPGSSFPNAPGRDRLNNTECVLVYAPAPGFWTVDIIGFNVPWGPQPYALVMTGGIATEMGIVSLNKDTYRSDATVNITLIDTDLNMDPNSTDTANVSIWSTTESTLENVVMTETGDSTSVFVGMILLDNNAIPSNGDGLLQVQNHDNITVEYYDANNGLNGSGYIYDYAVVDGDPPTISNVQAKDLRFNRATITWDTDESSDSLVLWGDSLPPLNSKSDMRKTLNHSISLSGLTENSTYYFAVASTDDAGNQGYDDNGSAYYEFTTTPRPPIAPPSDEWPTYHNNPSRQGVSPSTFEPPLEKMWTQGPCLESLWTSPVYSQGVLYTTSLDGRIHAWDAFEGTLLWERNLGDQYFYTGSPVVVDGIVYCSFSRYGNTSSEGTVYALDALTGATIWSTGPETGMYISARQSMLAHDGVLFGGAWTRQLWAMDMSDGSVIWTYAASEYTLSGGALGSGIVYFTLKYSEDILAIDEYSGTLVWQAVLDSVGVGPPLYAQGCVYIGTVMGTMYCFDGGDGAVVWQKSGLGSIDFGTPAYDGSAIYFGTFDGSCYALDAGDGTQLWSVSAGGQVGSAVSYANGYLYGTTANGYLTVRDAGDGTLVDSHQLKAESLSSPAVSDGWVWCEDYDGNVYAFMGRLPVGLMIRPASNASDALPGSVVDYWIKVNNTGTSGPDTFDVEATPGALGWTVDLLEPDGSTPLNDSDSDGVPDTGQLAPLETKYIIVRVSVPAGALAFDSDTSLVTFTSSNDLDVSKNSTLVTTVPGPGVEISSNMYFPLAPGGVAVAPLVVKNAGAFPDTIDITAGSAKGWTVWLFESDGVTPLSDSDTDGVPDTGILTGLGTYDIVVQILVPGGAPIGSADTTTVTGNSSLDVNASGHATIVIDLAPEPNDDWPTFHNDNARRGFSPSAFTPPLTLEWVSPSGYDSYYEAPVVADNMVFMPTMDGMIRAFEDHTGTLVWSRSLGWSGYYSTMPVVSDGLVYVTFYNGNSGTTVYALDEFTGDTVWTLDTSSGIYISRYTTPAVADGMYFGIGENGELFAVNSMTGESIWTVFTYQYLARALAIGGGMVFIADQGDGYLSAYDEMTGALIWSCQLDSYATHAPLYALGNLYIGTVSGTLYSIDAAMGGVLWTVENLGAFYRVTPAYDGAALFFGTEDYTYYAIDPTDGTILWTASAGAWIESSSAVANGYVYTVEYDGRLTVLDGTTGTLVQELYLGFYSISTPAIADGWVYVSDGYGCVYAYSGLMPVGVEVDPSFQSLEVVPSTVVDYSVDVTNLGSLPSDVFDVILTPGANAWVTELLHSDRVTPLSDTDADGIVDTGTMTSESTMEIVLRVTVPSGAAGGDFEVDTLEFVSSNDVNISKTTTATTIVPPPGVDIGPRTHFTVMPGDVVQATMTVSNTGGVQDTIDIETSSVLGWPVSLFGPDGTTPLVDTDSDGIVDVGELQGLSQTTIVVRVEVPLGATEGSLDRASVNATSSIDVGEWAHAEVVLEITPPPNAEWPTYMNNDVRQGRSPCMLMPGLDYMWSDSVSGGSDWTSPILDNGILFTTTTDGYLRAREPMTGMIYWEDQLGSPGEYTGTPVAYNDTIYTTFSTGNYTGIVYAVDELTGVVIWSNSDLIFNEYAYMAASDGIVFATTWDGQVVALDADDGSEVWNYSTSYWIYGGPTVAAGMVLVANEIGDVYAIDKDTGGLVWSRNLGQMTWSVPMVARGMVFMGMFSPGGMYALDAFTGETVWYVGGLQVDSSTPAYDGENIYIGAGSAYYALNADTGEQIWTKNVYSYIASSLAYANGYLVGVTTEGDFRLMDASDGTVIQQWGIGSSTSSPAISNGWVFVENSYGYIFAFRGQLPYSVEVSPTLQFSTGLPGSYAEYVVTVTNLGVVGADVFDATVTEGAFGWDVELYQSDGVTPLADTDSDGIPDTGELGIGNHTYVVIHVLVPASFNLSDIETSIVTFTSSMDPSISDYATFITDLPPPGCTIQPRSYFTPSPGDTVLAALNVTNIGPLPDTFDLTMISRIGWTFTVYEQDGVTPIGDSDSDGVPDTGELASGASHPIIVEVLVPIDALPDSLEVIWMTGTSSVDPNHATITPVILELAAQADPDWPSFHHDKQRSGVNPVDYELPLRPLWTNYDPDNNWYCWYGPIINDEKVVLTNDWGQVSAYDLMTGELLWEQQYGDAMDIPSSAAAAYGNIYVAFNVLDSYNGTWQVMMTCLDEATGAMVWSWTTSTTYGGYPWMAPLVAAGTVYWTDYNGGHVYANDAVTGDILWTYEIPNDGWVDGGPTYWGGMIFIEDDVGQVTALDALTGNLIWMTSSYDDYFSSAVAVDNGVVYALGSSSILHALDAFTGETLWQTDDIGGWSPYQSPIVANGMAYFGVNLYSSNSTVRFIAVDTATGDTIWSTMLYDTNLDESFAYNNGSLFVACNDGVLYVIDASNGDVLQALDVNSGVWLASVALGDGVVVVSSGNGTIAAFAFAGVGEPRDVVITPDTGAVEVTGSMAFHAAAIDVLGHQLEGYSINWSSANGLGTIVPTDEFGEDIVFVAGPIAGTETLYANVGIYAAAATVNILAGDTYTVVVQPADCYLVAGDTQQFTAIALDRWGNEISGATFSWDASPSIGIVDGTGLLTAGTAVATGAVSATFAGVTGTAEVEVGPGPLVSLAANPNSVTDIVDSTTIIVATAYDQFGNEIPGLTFVWATDIGSVTTASQASAVFNAGTVVGYGNITLSCGAVSVYVPVQVLPGAPYQVIVQPVDCQVVATDTQQFTAIAYDIWGNEVPGTNFVWDASPSIGMINGAGLLTAGTATATGVVSAAFAGVTGFAEVEVVPGPLVSIAASPNSVTDVVDSSTIVLATGYDQFGNEISGLAFVWSTDIGSIAAGPQASTLFSAGTVAGYGNITLSCGTLSIYVQVHVLPGALYQIILTPTDIELIPDQTQAFSAVPVDIYGNVISGLTLTWSASSSIGTITQGGVLTAGTTVATGTVNVGSGMIAAEASVEVVPGALDSIVVAPAFLTITVGSTTSLTATGYDQYGNALTGLTFVWSADSGTVTALGDRSIAQYGAPTVAGSATVTVSVGMVSTQVPATIIPGPLAHLSVSPTSESISAGGTQTFTATGTDVFGNVLSGLTLAWSASSALGTISQAGVLTAATTVATGTVTVTSGSFTATADVEVVPDALASIVLSPSPLATVAGHTEAIAAVGLDQYGNEIAGLTFTWSATAGTVSPIDVIRSMVTYAVPTSAGFENVTATVGAVSGTVQVTIAPGQLMTIVVTPISTNVTAGSGTSFSAQPLDMYGNPIPGTTITWTTTGGTITPAGVLSAPTAVGSIVVTATSGSVHGRASVGVIPGALDSIMVSPTTLDLKTGDGASIVVKAYDQYGNELDGLTMTWSTTIGTIDASEDGYEAAFGAGEQTGKGTITVICGDESASVTVDIGSASIPLGRQLAQPMSLLFIAIAVILGLLLLMMYLKGRKAGGGETEQESGPQENTGA